ncbi:hypothetical protein ACSFB7_30620 [Variovorax sp. GB1P17]
MKFTPDELAALPSIFEGREAIIFSPVRVARVRVFGVKANDRAVFGQYQCLETLGLNHAQAAADFSAPVSELCATPTFLAGYHNDGRFFFDPVVIERVRAIVSVLAPGLIYRDDYTSGPPSTKPGVLFGTVAMLPGPCASKLTAYLRRQALIEDPDDAEILAYLLKKESNEGMSPDER